MRKMRLTSKTKKVLVVVAAVLVAMFVFGAIGIIDVDKVKSLGRERNDDNLITLKSIQLESGKDNDTDITIDVNEKTGALKLKGKASADAEYLYATVELPAGTYSLTGAEDGTLKTYYMLLTCNGQQYRSDGDPIVLAGETNVVNIVIVVKEDTSFGLLGTTILPVLCEEGDDVSFWN